MVSPIPVAKAKTNEYIRAFDTDFFVFFNVAHQMWGSTKVVAVNGLLPPTLPTDWLCVLTALENQIPHHNSVCRYFSTLQVRPSDPNTHRMPNGRYSFPQCPDCI